MYHHFTYLGDKITYIYYIKSAYWEKKKAYSIFILETVYLIFSYLVFPYYSNNNSNLWHFWKEKGKNIKLLKNTVYRFLYSHLLFS